MTYTCQTRTGHSIVNIHGQADWFKDTNDDVFLHQNFSFFYTKIFCFFYTKFFSFFTPIFFIDQKFCFFYTKILILEKDFLEKIGVKKAKNRCKKAKNWCKKIGVKNWSRKGTHKDYRSSFKLINNETKYN